MENRNQNNRCGIMSLILVGIGCFAAGIVAAKFYICPTLDDARIQEVIEHPYDDFLGNIKEENNQQGGLRR